MTEIAEKAKEEVERKGSYEEADIRRALIEVAACSGNTHQAARNLADDPDALSISQPVLWEWANRRHLETYESLRAEALPVITAHAAEQHMALARYQADTSLEAAEKVKDRLDQMDDKDLVNAMGKLDIGSGIHTQRAQELSGQPAPKAERTVEELLRGLGGRGLQLGERRKEADGSVTERVAVVGPDESKSQGRAVPASPSDSIV
jgi:hypothetical protein